MSLPLASSPPVNGGLRTTLWVLQILLAVVFAASGILKISSPIAELEKMLPWVHDAPALMVRFIGIAELAGAIGLILPAATRISPILTPFASLSLTVVMTLAVLFHLTRKEFGEVPLPLVLGVLSGLVTWGRLHPAKIHSRRRERRETMLHNS